LSAAKIKSRTAPAARLSNLVGRRDSEGSEHDRADENKCGARSENLESNGSAHRVASISAIKLTITPFARIAKSNFLSCGAALEKLFSRR
jgi:hypothetical protein